MKKKHTSIFSPRKKYNPPRRKLRVVLFHMKSFNRAVNIFNGGEKKQLLVCNIVVKGR